MGVLNDYTNAAAVNAALNKGVEANKAVSELKEDLSKLNGNITGNIPIVFSKSDHYINTADSPVDLSALVQGTTTWHRAIIDCSEGDRFKIQVDGGDEARAWAFISSDGTILSNAESSKVTSYINTTITAPANTAALIIQDQNKSGTNKSYLLNDDNLESRIADTESLLIVKDLSSNISWTPNKAVIFGYTEANRNGDTSNSSVFKITKYISLKNISEFTITIPVYTTASDKRAMFGLAFYNDNDVCVGGYQMKFGEKSAEEVTIQVPEGATKFRTTYYKDDYTGYVYNKDFVYTPKYKDSDTELFSKVNSLEDRVNSIETQSLTHYNCIGSPTPYYVTKDSAYEFTVTLDNINNKFDEFVSTYPDIIAREADIGYDQTGTYAMRHYAIKPMKPAIFSTRSDEFIRDDNNNSWDETNKEYGIRRILLTMGMHSSGEKDSIKGTIAAIEDLLSSSEEWAMFIKNNFIIDVIPCINPWGLVNNSSNNSSGINLNRDFKKLSQQETKNIKALIDSLVPKGLIGVIDTHNTNVGGDGYWVTKKSYKYYNNYVRMSQQLNRMVTPLFKSLYGDNTYNGVHFYLWNYGSGETGQMHEYVDSLGLLTVSCEARNNVDKTYLATQMLVPNLIQMFGTFE